MGRSRGQKPFHTKFHYTTAHRPSDPNLCSARVLPAPPTADTQSRAWGEERERGEAGVTSVVQFVRARAPCGLLAGGRAIFYQIFLQTIIEASPCSAFCSVLLCCCLSSLVV